jgi:hypothetical protein
MLRITPHISSFAILLEVEGTLTAPWVHVLQAHLDGSTKPVELDLSRVSFIDQEGAALVERACTRGCRIKAASHFVSLMLTNSPTDSPAGKEG